MRIINAIRAQNVGGVDQVFRNYTQVLLESGHKVGLLISENKNCEYDFLEVKEIFKLKNKSQIGDFFNLLKIVILFKPDIIICHSNRLMSWMKFLRFFNKIGLTKAKSVAVNHGISFSKSLNCDYIININKEINDLVVKAGFNSNKSFILPNVIDVNLPFIKKSVKNAPVIGIYGRIEHRKGFDLLIKASGILAQRNYDFRLKIGGFEVPGNYNLQTLKNIADKNNILEKCDFVGVVKNKPNFFKDVDIFCVPSREEPFGLVILEGFLHSTLVISSNTDGGKLLIENGEDGLLFNNEDEKDLAAKIELVLKSLEVYEKITKKAFEKLENKYSLKNLKKEMSEILQVIAR
ncbi:MAG: glycosyltransferase family 4 protein [Pelagibacterales bacterium]|nr:glycosyltransferase family 4 protein [Pelagibacterales bacterium]